MADVLVLHLNHDLCFLFSKINKYDSKIIKQSVFDFFSSDDIHEAKEAFLGHVSTLNNVELLLKIRARRGNGRAEHEVDDIFAIIINELDETLILNQLPTFVSDAGEKMPSISVVEVGDIRAVMNL
jgi:hypothetical protein